MDHTAFTLESHSFLIWPSRSVLLVLSVVIVYLLLVMPATKRDAKAIIDEGRLKTTMPTKRAKTNKASVKEARLPHYSGSTTSTTAASQSSIKKIFDSFRDDPTNEPDKIGIDGSMKYLPEIGIGMEDVSFVTILDLLDAPSMGEFTREGFVQGWLNVASASNTCDTIERQRTFATALCDRLTSDAAYFRQVYKACFKYAKPEGQRAVPAEQAFVFWDMFFGGGKYGIDWSGSSTPWYEYWREYYTTKNNRPVNKDLWNQVAELVNKTRESGGETLEWWSEDGAWPTAVDDFVAFVKEKRAAGSGMDTS